MPVYSERSPLLLGEPPACHETKPGQRHGTARWHRRCSSCRPVGGPTRTAPGVRGYVMGVVRSLGEKERLLVGGSDSSAIPRSRRHSLHPSYRFSSASLGNGNTGEPIRNSAASCGPFFKDHDDVAQHGVVGRSANSLFAPPRSRLHPKPPELRAVAPSVSGEWELLLRTTPEPSGAPMRVTVVTLSAVLVGIAACGTSTDVGDFGDAGTVPRVGRGETLGSPAQ